MDIAALKEGAILLVDKPRAWTSFDVVNKLRYALKVKKIGHAGTLDPLATGLMLVGVGSFTKKLNELQGLDKCYEGIFEIGKTTPSYDLETDFESEVAVDHIVDEAILKAAEDLTGPLDQLPPIYSAIKVNGKRAYKHARKQEEVKLEPRPVVVHSFEVRDIQGAEVHFTIKCSKGTYIRSIAHDLGQILGVGAYLKELRRTHVGDYAIEEATALEELVDLIRGEDDR